MDLKCITTKLRRPLNNSHQRGYSLLRITFCCLVNGGQPSITYCLQKHVQHAQHLPHNEKDTESILFFRGKYVLTCINGLVVLF